MIPVQDISNLIELIIGPLVFWRSLVDKFGIINRKNAFYVCSVLLQFQAVSDSHDEVWQSTNPLGRWPHDQQPLYVVKARHTRDISNAVRCASLSGLRVAPGTIRQSADMFSLGVDNSTVLVDLTRMSGITHLDLSQNTASVLPGTLVGTLQEELDQAEAGMWFSIGLSPSVGIAESLLGGGRNLWSNQIGGTSDQLVAAKVVLSDGSVVTASQKKNPDLLWALKGGGEGNFGIVSEMTIAIYKQPKQIRTLRYVWSSNSTPQLFCHFTRLIASQRHKMTTTDDKQAEYWKGRTIRLGVTQQKFTAVISIQNPDDNAKGAEDERVASMKLGSLPEPLSIDEYESADMNSVMSQLSFEDEWDVLLNNPTEPPIIKEKNVLLRQDNFMPSVYCGLFARQMWLSDQRIDRCEVDFYGGTINEYPVTATSFAHRRTGINLNFRSIANAVPSNNESQPIIPWSVNAWTHFQSIALNEAYRSPTDPDLSVSMNWAQMYYAENLYNLLVVRNRYDPNRLFDIPQGLSRLQILVAPR